MAFQLLFADDSATMHRVVQITLAREAAQLLGVSSGRDAVLRAREARPDIAVLDTNMPDMDGYAACQALKDDPSTGHIPVLLLASSQTPLDAQRAQECGADGHLLKPFDTQSFVDKVKQTLSLAGARAAPSAEVRALEPAVSAPAPKPQPVAPAAWAPAATAAPRTPGLAAAPAQPRPQPGAQMATAAPFTGARPQPAAAPMQARPTPTPTPARLPFAGTTTPAAVAPKPLQSATPPQAQPQFHGLHSGQNAALQSPRPALNPAAAGAANATWSVSGSAAVAAAAPPTSRPQAAGPLTSAAAAPAAPPGASAPTPRPQALVGQSNTGPNGAALAPRPAATVPPVGAATAPRAPTAVSAAAPNAGGLDAAELMAAAKEILERVAWEVVPPMAEAMLKEHIERLARR